MLRVYINYPNSWISFHKGLNCFHFNKGNKYKRLLEITEVNKDSVIDDLKNKMIVFDSTRNNNDIWLTINLRDPREEEIFADKFLSLLQNHYNRLANSKVQKKCGYGDAAIENNISVNTSILPGKRTKNNSSIRDKELKAQKIINTITTRISAINRLFRFGPDLYFYKKIISSRRTFPSIKTFLESNHNIELLYATLVAWDMNSRGAKMKYFYQFKDSIIKPLKHLEKLEAIFTDNGLQDEEYILKILGQIYLDLDLMVTKSRLVANSKTLHFLFPDFLVPMDKTNTLSFLYTNNNESVDRYLEIVRFSFELMKNPIDFSKYLDQQWNQTVPKLIDNAIILIMGKSLRYAKY